MSNNPLLIFCYKRLNELKMTVSALKENKLAQESELFIFSDAAKTYEDQFAVSEVRAYLKSINGFKKINIIEATINKGLANSIIDGVTSIFEFYDKVIVLEDDLITSTNFLSYMNQCLKYYEENKCIFSISGFSFPIKNNEEADVYFTKRSSSWGWATWKNRWEGIDWNISDYNNFKLNRTIQRSFNRMGSDLSAMLIKQMEGKMDSWAIRWCYHQFKKDLFTVYPIISKVINIGFSDGATHTIEHFNRYPSILDQSNNVNFKLTEPYIKENIINQFTRRYSLSSRVKYKALNLIAASIKHISRK